MSHAMDEALARANAELDAIGKLDQFTLLNTAAALDYTRWKAQCVANVASLLGETSADSELRNAGMKAAERFQEWNVSVDYRDDVYRTLKMFAATTPHLEGEDGKLLDDSLRDFRRAGLHFPRETQREIEASRKELADIAAQFDANISSAQAPLTFTRPELHGMPEEFFAKPGIKIGANEYRVLANVIWQFNEIEDKARLEATRRKVYVAHDSMAREANVPLLNRMLRLRNRIALRLGYKSWADYQTETQMAKNAARAERYVSDLAAGLQPKFDAEVGELQKLKAADTRNPAARLMAWDWRFYQSQLKKESAVDVAALRKWFPFERVRDGMFAIYGRTFGLQFQELGLDGNGTPGLQLFAVSDAVASAPLGLLYLDFFTHEGKTNVGGAGEIIPGRSLPDGRYRRPVASVSLNFEPPSADAPSLLTHEQVEILFHEFGHALHAVLTQAKYARFSGTSVPRDFVEAPSQMLQNWVWDARVLGTFAADHHDASTKVTANIVGKMRASQRASAGIFYRRQCAFALADLTLHGPHDESEPYDCVGVSNAVFEKIFLPIDRATAFIASFRGMNGYDAGYYGYLWSEAMSADMATVFEKAPEAYLDRTAGMRLRHEIYETGGARDVNESVEKFLGRKMSTAPFLEKLGLRELSSRAKSRDCGVQP